jgi:hypothetical protein
MCIGGIRKVAMTSTGGNRSVAMTSTSQYSSGTLCLNLRLRLKRAEALMGTGFAGKTLLKKLAWAGILATTMAVTAGAQMPEGGGAGAFAGGQMVRGTVTAVSADKISVKTEAGDAYQIAVSANTRLMKARQPVKTTDIKAGDGIGAMGVLDAPTKTVHAVLVTVIDADEVKKAREGMGKAFITGKITAMDEVKLTILRTDGVTQVIEVDENTSFKRGGQAMALLNSGAGVVNVGGGFGDGGGGRGGARGGATGSGESITLADIKVGDTVAGQGAVKNGVFVPAELGVADGGGAGQRRRRPGNAGGAVAPAAGAAPPTVPGNTALPVQ